MGSLVKIGVGILLTCLFGVANADIIVNFASDFVVLTEPSTLALFGFGSAGLVLLRRNAK